MHKTDQIWERFVGKNPKPSVISLKNKCITEAGDFLILNNVYKGIKNAAALNIGNNNGNNVISANTLFDSCNSKSSGGSICIENGLCIQYRVCSFGSNIISNGEPVGAHSAVKTIEENYVIESSIMKSRGYSSTLYIECGKQIIDSTNISYNSCYRSSAVKCYNNSFHIINYTTICNNTSESQAISLHRSSNQQIFRCNYLGNNASGKYNHGIIFINNANLMYISYCTFLKNDAEYIFYVTLTDFYIIDQCHALEPTRKIINKNTKIAIVNYFPNNLPHLSTQYCQALITFILQKKILNQESLAPSLISYSLLESTIAALNTK